jgi:hypothetical protein
MAMSLCRLVQLRLSQGSRPCAGHPAAQTINNAAKAEDWSADDAKTHQTWNCTRVMNMVVDSAFLRKEDKLLRMKIKCTACGSEIRMFVNDNASAGEVWPFCEKCGTYVNVVPAE